MIEALYVEDDLIDQMNFSRLAEKNQISLTVASSKLEAVKILCSKKFDLIVLDFNLADCNAIEILNEMENQEVAIFASPEMLEHVKTSCVLRYWEKPLSQAHINELIEHKLNLTYFNALTENDPVFKIELLNIALNSITDSVSKLKVALYQKDAKIIKFEAHKMKSGVRAVGISIISLLATIEQDASNENWENLTYLLNKVFLKSEAGISQIESMLKTLEQI